MKPSITLIELEPKQATFADVVRCIEHDYPDHIRHVSPEQLHELTRIDPRFNEPTHIAIPVTLEQHDTASLYMVFTNLGQIVFQKNECLKDTPIDKETHYFNYTHPSLDRVYQSHEIIFKPGGLSNWDATYDFGHIWAHLDLDGQDDHAPFVGFYRCQEK